MTAILNNGKIAISHKGLMDFDEIRHDDASGFSDPISQ